MFDTKSHSHIHQLGFFREITLERSPFPTQFRDFWELYLNEHQSRMNQWLHATGTGLSLVLSLYCFVTEHYLGLILVPVVGYGFAWFGHLFIEKNQPLSLKAPLWSLICDYRLFVLMLLWQAPTIQRAKMEE